LVQSASIYLRLFFGAVDTFDKVASDDHEYDNSNSTE